MKTNRLPSVLIFSLILIAANAFSQVPGDPESRIEWKYKTEDAIYASPLISDGTLYIGSTDSIFYALDARTGQEKWHYPSAAPIQSTAAIHGNLVFFESGNNLIALKKGGKLKWEKNLCDGEILNQMDPWDYYHSSPCLHDGVVYIGSANGVLWGFDAKSGEQVLRCQTLSEQAIRTTPVVMGNLVIYGDWEGVLYANDITTGSLAWKYDTEKEGTSPWPNSILSSLAIDEGQVYFAGKSNRLYSLDARTGRKNWHYQSPTNQWLIGGPVLADGVVYLGSSDQHLFHAIDASTGELLWSTGLDSRIWGRALIVGELIYIGSNSLFILDKGTGRILNKVEFPRVHEEIKYGEYTDRSANFHSSPVPFGGKIILGSDDGYIYAIREL